jgi:hypothetical protein
MSSKYTTVVVLVFFGCYWLKKEVNSDLMHKVTRGLRERSQNSHCATTRVIRKKRQALLNRGLQSTVPASRNEPEASEVLHLPHGIMIMTQINNDTSFTKRHFPPFRNVVQILRAPRTMTSKSISHFDTRLPTFWQRCYACHADDKMPYTSLYNYTCPASVTQNDVSSFKVSRMSNACHTKWT